MRTLNAVHQDSYQRETVSNFKHYIRHFAILSEKKYTNWIAIWVLWNFNTALDEIIKYVSKWFILTLNAKSGVGECQLCNLRTTHYSVLDGFYMF